MIPISTFSFPTTIHTGPGARNRLPEALRQAGVLRPLLVTDRDLVAMPPVDAVRALLDGHFETTVYSKIFGNPLVSQALLGVDAYRSAHCDSIVAVGGGAALDVAKVIALMAHHPGSVEEYEDGCPEGRPVDQPLPFIAALPTTAGTGSEVGRAAVVSDDATHVKRIILSPRLLPRVVFADAELTVGLPVLVTAATGMDALTHLVEAYLVPTYHPMADGIALQGIGLVAEALESAVAFARQGADAEVPGHLEARHTMLNAAMMGAVAFQKGLGLTHSCAHALSTLFDLHHGLANGIMLPAAMAFNRVAAPERFAALAHAAGAGTSGDDFMNWLIQLRTAVGIPRSLRDVGVGPRDVPRLVEVALADGCHATNPCPVEAEDFKHVFEQALGEA